MGGISDAFAERAIAAAVDLERVDAHLRSKIFNLLTELRDELAKKIQESELQGLTATEQFRRQKDLFERVQKSIETAYAKMAGTLETELVELADVVQDQTVAIGDEVIGANVFDASLSRNQLEAIAKTTLVNGNPAAAWWSKQSADLQHNFQQQINLGMVAGESVDQLVNRIRGTRSGSRTVTSNGKKVKVPVYVGGIMETTTREATALVRTAVHAVSNNTIFETYRQNKDLVKGMQAQVTLDNRTTLVCISRSKGAWDWEGNPLPDSPVKIPFPGPPPWHWQCRTVLIPITRSWEELIEESSGKKVTILEKEVPDSQQQSMDGLVAGDLSYEDWLKKQPEERQIEVLGKGRWDLWRRGKITFAQLVDQSGNPLTIEELRAKVGEGKTKAPKVPKPEAPKEAQSATTIDPAQTISDLEKLISQVKEAKTWDDLKIGLKTRDITLSTDRLGPGDQFGAEYDPASIPVEPLKEGILGVLHGMTGAPAEINALLKNIHVFGLDPEQSNAFAYFRAKLQGGNAAPGGQILFNVEHLKDPAKYKATLKRLDVENWLAGPDGTMSFEAAVGVHEFGHFVDWNLWATTQVKERGGYWHSETDGYWQERSKEVGKQYLKEEVEEQVSTYGATNAQEAFAEMWVIMNTWPIKDWPPAVRKEAEALRVAYLGGGGIEPDQRVASFPIIEKWMAYKAERGEEGLKAEEADFYKSSQEKVKAENERWAEEERLRVEKEKEKEAVKEEASKAVIALAKHREALGLELYIDTLERLDPALYEQVKARGESPTDYVGYKLVDATSTDPSNLADRIGFSIVKFSPATQTVVRESVLAESDADNRFFASVHLNAQLFRRAPISGDLTRSLPQEALSSDSLEFWKALEKEKLAVFNEAERRYEAVGGKNAIAVMKFSVELMERKKAELAEKKKAEEEEAARLKKEEEEKAAQALKKQKELEEDLAEEEELRKEWELEQVKKKLVEEAQLTPAEEKILRRREAYEELFNEWEERMPPAQAQAFEFWTEDGYKPIRAIQKGLRIPREYGEMAVHEVKEIIEHMEKGLARAPKFTGKVYRGFDDMRDRRVIEQMLTEGSILITDAFTSWTESEGVAKSFATPHGGYILEMQANGTAGAKIPSGLPEEAEILFDKGAKYRVDRVVRAGEELEWGAARDGGNTKGIPWDPFIPPVFVDRLNATTTEAELLAELANVRAYLEIKIEDESSTGFRKSIREAIKEIDGYLSGAVEFSKIPTTRTRIRLVEISDEEIMAAAAPPVAEAATLDDHIAQVEEAESWDELETALENAGIDLRSDATSDKDDWMDRMSSKIGEEVPIESLRHAVIGVLRGMKGVPPEIAARLKTIHVYPFGGGSKEALAYFRPEQGAFEGGRIVFNALPLMDPLKNAASMARTAEEKFLVAPKGGVPLVEGLGIHEFGHFVDWQLGDSRKYKSTWDFGPAPKGAGSAKKQVSEYAGSNEKELAAEVWVVIMTWPVKEWPPVVRAEADRIERAMLAKGWALPPAMVAWAEYKMARGPEGLKEDEKALLGPEEVKKLEKEAVWAALRKEVVEAERAIEEDLKERGWVSEQVYEIGELDKKFADSKKILAASSISTGYGEKPLGWEIHSHPNPGSGTTRFEKQHVKAKMKPADAWAMVIHLKKRLIAQGANIVGGSRIESELLSKMKTKPNEIEFWTALEVKGLATFDAEAGRYIITDPLAVLKYMPTLLAADAKAGIDLA